MTGLLRALGAVGAYYAILFAATVLTFRIGAPPEDTGDVLWSLLPVQLALFCLCAVYVSRCASWRAIGFGRVHWRGFVWLIPSCVVLALMAISLLPHVPGLARAPGTLLLLVAVPALIGITEEIMFRGILLRAAMARLPLFSAMLLSATLFALMHGIIGIGGQPVIVTSQQVAFAFLVGVFLAPIAVETRSLWGVIIWHGVWDFLVYASQIAGITHHYALIGIMIQALVSVWLWARLVRAQT